MGFSSAAKLNGAKSSWSAPSAAALARAAQKMRQWDEDFAREDATTSASTAMQDIENAHVGPSSSSFVSASAARPTAAPSFQTPLRPALRPMENSPAQLPDTPLAARNPTHYTNIGGGVQMKNKPFKSPLVKKQGLVPAASAARPGSSLNPANTVSSSRLPAVFTFGVESTVPTAVPATPARAGPVPGPSSVTLSPGKGRNLGMTPYRISGGGVKSVGKTKFSTPFKPGMGPGEVGRAQLEARMKAEAAIQTPVRVGLRGTPSASAKGKAVARREYAFFDLSKP